MSDKPEGKPKITASGIGSFFFFTMGTLGQIFVLFGVGEDTVEMMAWSAAMYAAGACAGTFRR